jgi:lipoprotein NlpD
MPTKLLIATLHSKSISLKETGAKALFNSALCLLLAGCFTNDPSTVIVIDKSLNKENAVSSFTVEMAQGINEPSESVKASQANAEPEKKKVKKKSSWSIPVDAEILKKYSPDDQHLGITFATEPGQEVRAIRDGTVVYSGSKMKSYGKMIIVKHAFGFYSSYTQNQILRAREGDQVEKGQVIALTGENPFYFEMKKYSDPINPLKYLK